MMVKSLANYTWDKVGDSRDYAMHTTDYIFRLKYKQNQYHLEARKRTEVLYQSLGYSFEYENSQEIIKKKATETLLSLGYEI